MSTSNRVNKIANLLLSHSLGDNGRVDKEKVSIVLEDLRKNPPLQHIEILKRFAFLVKKHMSSYQGILEYNGGNGTEMAERLCSKDFIKSNSQNIVREFYHFVVHNLGQTLNSGYSVSKHGYFADIGTAGID